jgi:chloramphenicol-sensitive protein RarD
VAVGWLTWATLTSSAPVWGHRPDGHITAGAGRSRLHRAAAAFTAAARLLPYSTLGILQFIAPTLQFLVAVFLFGEPFTTAHVAAFACIWSAAGLYLWSALRQA